MSQRWRRWLGVIAWLGIAGSVWLAAADGARAQQTIAVLGLGSEEGDDGLAASITSAVRSEAQDRAEYDVSSSQVSLAQMTMAQDCEISDAQCRIAVANALRSDRIVYGTLLRPNRRTYELELHLANGRDGTETRASRTFSSRDTSDAAFARLARELLAELRGETPPPSVEAAQTPAVAPAPAPVGEDPEDARTGAEATLPSDDEPSSNDWLGYTLVGVAVASTAMTAVSWIQIDKAEQDPGLVAYRKVVDPEAADACDEAERGVTNGLGTNVVDDARSACRQGRTFEVLQYVFLGVALASAGAGAYFLLDDESSGEATGQRRALALRPRVTPRSAALDLRLSF